MKIAVIIPAGGESTRFGTKDKLAEDLGGRPLLLRTVEFFTKRDDVTQIVVAGPQQSFADFKNRFETALSFHGVSIVEGGATRSVSVKNALVSISDEVEVVVVHDAARPAINNDLFDRILLANREFSAVAAALPLNGTVKRAQENPTTVVDEDAVVDSILGTSSQGTAEGYKVVETVDRSGLWEIQTPQCFELSLLKLSYAQDGIEGCTDDAQVVEKFGEPVYLVNGDSRNIKVTTPQDLQLIKSILGVKGAADRPVHKRF